MVKILHNPERQLIHMVTAGSVDDGKSTLIGRMLHDCQAIYEDQLSSIKKASQKRGFADIDFSLLTDGLSAEREQGITIDVAYRYFSTPNRRFVIADVPGHEQYTRNMVTGASNADLALILVDARKGMLRQSKRHLFISSLLGIPHIAVVINKMDLVDYDQQVFEKIKKDFINFATKLKIGELEFIPVSSIEGDMVVNRGKRMDWYGGHTVFNYIDNLEIATDRNLIDFRFPIQYVIRPNQDLRGYAGKVEGGTIKPGENVTVLPSNQQTKIKSIIYNQGEQQIAFNPQSVVLTLEDEVDASRGEMIVRQNNLPEMGNDFEAMICWFDESLLQQGKEYLIKHTTKTTRCTVENINYQLDINTLKRVKEKTLSMNEIARISINTLDPIFFDAYLKNRNTGSFYLIDQVTNNTVGAGVILRKKVKKDITERFEANKGVVLWFTGLSGSGKSTIADKVHDELVRKGVASERLDGDIIRELINKDLGFSKKDRDENIKRAAYLANLLSKHGVVVLATFISPYKKHRQLVKKTVGNFVEIFVNTPLEICESRDVKGLYKKARKGEIKNFTGISDPYEKPKNPDIKLDTKDKTLDESASTVIEYISKIIDKNLN